MNEACHFGHACHSFGSPVLDPILFAGGQEIILQTEHYPAGYYEHQTQFEKNNFKILLLKQRSWDLKTWAHHNKSK